MLKVVFCTDGQPVNDFSACNFVDGVINGYCRGYGEPMEIRFSTEAVLDAFVLRVMEDKIPMNRIEFYYHGPEMVSDVKMEFHEIRGLEIPEGVRDIGVRPRNQVSLETNFVRFYRISWPS